MSNALRALLGALLIGSNVVPAASSAEECTTTVTYDPPTVAEIDGMTCAEFATAHEEYLDVVSAVGNDQLEACLFPGTYGEFTTALSETYAACLACETPDVSFVPPTAAEIDEMSCLEFDAFLLEYLELAAGIGIDLVDCLFPGEGTAFGAFIYSTMEKTYECAAADAMMVRADPLGPPLDDLVDFVTNDAKLSSIHVFWQNIAGGTVVSGSQHNYVNTPTYTAVESPLQWRGGTSYHYQYDDGEMTRFIAVGLYRTLDGRLLKASTPSYPSVYSRVQVPGGFRLSLTKRR